MSESFHATAVLWQGCGILLRGSPGSGKSLLAARLIAKGGRLVGDDRLFVSACAGRLVATVPAAIAGLIEIRGRGPVPMPFERAAVIRLVADIVDDGTLARLPPPDEFQTVLLGVTVARQPVPRRTDHAVCLLRRALGAIVKGQAIEPCACFEDGQDAGRL